LFRAANVNDEKAVKAAIDDAVERLGPIRVLVNCAGVGRPQRVCFIVSVF
jgi:NAD(P)-dependent dehydrogenase (short-subunit alcohol dehydrogenase family)